MTSEERDTLYKYEKEKREVVIKRSLMMGLVSFENKINCINANMTKHFFQDKYENYLGNMLTQEKYKPSDFWFNDAGFQFKWRNFEGNIQLECLSWADVTKRIKQITT